MYSLDRDFLDAHWKALKGDATTMAAILRNPQRQLDGNERDTLALMIERLAEYARGDVGGKLGRPEKAAGHPEVVRIIDRYQSLLTEGRQKSEAKSMVATEYNISLRTVDKYITIHRERMDALRDAVIRRIK